MNASASAENDGSGRGHDAVERGEFGEQRAIIDRRAPSGDRGAARADRDWSVFARESALTDELTGCYQRGPGMRELEREVARSRGVPEPLSVAFVAVDHLEQATDSSGHAVGDRRLRQLANALRSGLRSYDVVVRYGDDQFICLMPGATTEVAKARLASITSSLRAAPDEGTVIGVAELQPDESIEALVRRADQALHLARGASST